MYSSLHRTGAVAAVLGALCGLPALTLLACNTAELSNGAPQGSADPTCADDDESCAAGKDGGASGGAGPADPPPASEGVTIQIEPGDEGASIVAAIRAAKTSVHMTMYLLTTGGLGRQVIDALGDQQDAGKDVKVVLNQTFPPNGGDNAPSFAALTKRGVEVHWASSAFAYTHAKTIVVDASKSVIMTMNMTETSASTNREYLAFDDDPDDAATLETLFTADFAGQAVKVSAELVVSPTAANDVAPRDKLKSLIGSATTSLDVEIQSLSDRTLVDAIIAAHARGIETRLLIDGKTSTTTAEVAAIAKLKGAGVPLRSRDDIDLHAKCIVVDEARTFVGSQNFTTTALTQNREVGVIADNPAEAAKVRTTIAADFDKARDL